MQQSGMMDMVPSSLLATVPALAVCNHALAGPYDASHCKGQLLDVSMKMMHKCI